MANLKKGSTISGGLIWSGANLKFTPAGDTVLFNGHKVYSDFDKPDVANGDVLNAVNKTGDTINGVIKFTNTPIIDGTAATIKLTKSDFTNDNAKGQVEIKQDTTGSLIFTLGSKDGNLTGKTTIKMPDGINGTIYTDGNKPTLTELGFNDYWLYSTQAIRPNGRDYQLASSSKGIIPFDNNTGYIGTSTAKLATGFINNLTSDTVNMNNSLYTGNGIVYFGNTTTGGLLRFSDIGISVLKPMILSGATGAISIGPNATNAIKMGSFSSGDTTQTMLVGDNTTNALPLQLVGRNTKKLTYKTLNASSVEVVYPIYHEGNKPTPAELGMYSNTEIDTKIDAGGKVGSVDGVLPDASKNVVLNAARLDLENIFTEKCTISKSLTLDSIKTTYFDINNNNNIGGQNIIRFNRKNALDAIITSSYNNFTIQISDFSTTAASTAASSYTYRFNGTGLFTTNIINGFSQVQEKGIRVYSPNNKPTMADLNFDVYTKTESDAKYLPLTGGVLTGSLQINNDNLVLKTDNAKNIYFKNADDSILGSIYVNKYGTTTDMRFVSGTYTTTFTNGIFTVPQLKNNGTFESQGTIKINSGGLTATNGTVNAMTGKFTGIYLAEDNIRFAGNNVKDLNITVGSATSTFMASGKLVLQSLSADSSTGTVSGAYGNFKEVQIDSNTKFTRQLTDGSVIGGLLVNVNMGAKFLFDNDGTLTIPKNLSALDVIVRSDIRDKVNPVKIENGLDVICSLNGYKYGLKTLNGVEDSAGLIAQELQSVAPELVLMDKNFEGDDRLRIKPVGVMGYMVDAIKTLSDKIEQLNQEIIYLKGDK